MESKHKKKKPPTVLYLVSSIQYVVSDTCACDQTGQRKKEEGKKKPAAYSHKVATQLQLYEKREQGFHQNTDSPEAR